MGQFSPARDPLPLLLAAAIGAFACFLPQITRIAMLDPLVLALVAGIVVRALAKEQGRLRSGSPLALRLLLPLGILFYAAGRVNFVQILAIPPEHLGLIAIVVAVYFLSILLLGRFLGQSKKITCLVATGSAVCGASAIAVTAPAVEAEADDISVSLLAVTLAALLGLFVILPLLGLVLAMSARDYGIMAGSLLQFTGFVREAVLLRPHLSGAWSPDALVEVALLIKTGRYFALLVSVPLFAAMVRRSFFFPWHLWAFLIASVVGTVVSLAADDLYRQVFLPVMEAAYRFSWSMAMAAVGMAADVRALLSDNGVKAFWMAAGGFCLALGVFCLLYPLIR